MENISALAQQWYDNHLEKNTLNKIAETMKELKVVVDLQQEYYAQDLDLLVENKARWAKLSNKSVRLKEEREGIEEKIVDLLRGLEVEPGKSVIIDVKGDNSQLLQIRIWYYSNSTMGVSLQ